MLYCIDIKESTSELSYSCDLEIGCKHLFMQWMFTLSSPQTFTWSACWLLPACISSALITAHQYYDHCDQRSIAIFGRSVSFIVHRLTFFLMALWQYCFSNKGKAISCSRPCWEIAYFKCTRLDLFSKITFVQFCLIYSVYAVIGSILKCVFLTSLEISSRKLGTY